jgi:hypothetical protein
MKEHYYTGTGYRKEQTNNPQCNKFISKWVLVHSKTLANTTTLHGAQLLLPATAQSNFYAHARIGYVFYTVTQIAL